jgi:hypothetical protein
VALVYLVWNVKNMAGTSKEMLSMYSSDLAAYAYENCAAVQEICIFWEVPYLEGNAKVTYEKTDNGMMKTDEIYLF